MSTEGTVVGTAAAANAERALLRAEGAARAIGRQALSFSDYSALFLIGLVVVLVSLPRLRRLALRENERDAIGLLRALGPAAEDDSEALAAGGLAGLLAANATHQNRFEDLELLDGGRLRRHGYLFDAVELDSGQWALRGWPWEHARTGLGAFVFTSQRGLIGSPNSDGRWDGPERPPALLEALSAGGWRSLKR